MKRFLLMGILALVVPTTALAKEPTSATISGPGLGTPVTIAGPENASPSPFGRLVLMAGVPPAMFGDRYPHDPMRSVRPQGTLGPRYSVTWFVPGPDGRTYELEQDVYPYATPLAVTYMEPGQSFFQTFRTHGGWYVGGPGLKQALVTAGLPPRAPSESSGLSAAALGGIGVAGAAALVSSVALALRLRRRPNA